jgi:hypothetical protein
MALCRPWEYFRTCRWHSVGRRSTPSCSILYSFGRENIPSRSIGYFVGRHNTCAEWGSILSAVKILAHNEEVFLLDVRVYKHRVNEKVVSWGAFSGIAMQSYALSVVHSPKCVPRRANLTEILTMCCHLPLQKMAILRWANTRVREDNGTWALIDDCGKNLINWIYLKFFY